MNKQHKLPAIFFFRLYIFPRLRVAVIDLLEVLMIELIGGSSRGQKVKQVTADHEAQDVSMLELKRAIGNMLTSHTGGHLRGLDDIVLSMLPANYSDFFLHIALITRLETGLELLFVRQTNLDWIKHLVQAVVHSNDLQILVAGNSPLDFWILLKGFK